MKNFTLSNVKKLPFFVLFLLFLTLGAFAQSVNSNRGASKGFDVMVKHYPDPSYANSPYVKVSWGDDLNPSFVDFEDETIPAAWDNSVDYPWIVAVPDSVSGYNGSFCMMSSNAGVKNSTSTIQVTYDFGTTGGSISFLAGCYGEGTEGSIYDACSFYIDDELTFENGELQSWDSYLFEVSAGTHTFKWTYSKDGSLNKLGDGFYVDDVTFTLNGKGRADATYNLYRKMVNVPAAVDPDLILEGTPNTQYVDEDWLNLAEGAYQYGVVIVGDASTGIFWSDPITKTPADEFHIVVGVDPDSIPVGTVTGAGTFYYGEKCTLTGIPADGYQFYEWVLITDSTELVVGEHYAPVYSFTVTKDDSIVARFEPLSFYPWTTSEPEEGGSAVFNNGENYLETLLYGDEVTIVAHPNEIDGYQFVNWTCVIYDHSIDLSDSATYTFTFGETFLNQFELDSLAWDELYGEGLGIDFIAHFKLAPFEITVTVDPQEGGTVTGEGFVDGVGTFEQGETCSLTATANTGYHFAGWAIGQEVIATENPYEFEVTSSANLVAIFELNQYYPYVTETPEDYGEAWVDSNNSQVIHYGEEVILRANPFYGYDFVNWTVLNPDDNTMVEISTDSVYTFTMDANHILTTLYPDGGEIEFVATFKVYVPCLAPIEVTATEVGSDYAILDWIEMSEAESWMLFYRYDSSLAYDSVEVSDLPFTLENLAQNTTYEAYVAPSCGFENDVWDETVFSEPIEFTTLRGKVCIGDGTGTNSYLPTYTYYKYSFTQQIYTVEELGEEGFIESIDFYCSQSRTRSLDIYLVNTDKETFEGETDWIPVTDNDLVFSGEISFLAGDWTTITLDQGFIYDGQHNLAIVVHDQTGLYTSASSFKSYDATNQAMRAYRDSNAYDPANPGVNGTRMSQKNQICLFKTELSDCMKPQHLVATEVGPDFAALTWKEVGASELWYVFYHDETPTPGYIPYDSTEVTLNPFTLTDLEPNTTYKVFVAPACGFEDGMWDERVISDTIEITTLEACPAPSDAAVSDITKNSATVTWSGYSDSYTLYYRVAPGINNPLFKEGFEGGAMPEGWTIEGDNQTEGKTWRIGAGDYHTTTGTHGGSYNALINYNSTGDMTYLITPAMDLSGQSGAILSFWYVNRSWAGDTDGLGVYYREGSDGAWQELWSTTDAHATWTNQLIPLTTVAANCQFGFMMTDNWGYGVGLDDIVIGFEETPNWTTIEEATTPQALTGLLPGTDYETFVMADCSQDAISDTITFTTEAIFEIAVSANPDEGGTVSGGAEYNGGETCTVTATPNEGYIFVDWTENGTTVSTLASYGFTVDGPRTLVANFQKIEYYPWFTIVPEDAGEAWVASNNAQVVQYGDDVLLKANPFWGYDFVQWTTVDPLTDSILVLSTDTVFSFTMNADNVLTSLYPEGGEIEFIANFEISTFQITATANPTEGGVIVSEGLEDGVGEFQFETICTLTARPNEGYDFLNWTENGTVLTSDTVYSFTVWDDHTLVANFQLRSYQITAEANLDAGGTVTGNNGTYNHFETCELTATPNEGYHFVNWTEDGEEVATDSIYSFEVTGARALVANFEINSYEIEATADPEEGGTIVGNNGTYNHFETCELTARANEGYDFLNWTEDGEVLSTDTVYSFEVTGARNLVANFQLRSYEITAEAYPEEGGTIEGAGTYNHFETCALTATPNEGYHFENWTEDGEEVATDSVYSFEVTGARDLVANFEINSYEIAATADPEEGGSVVGAGTYEHFNVCELVATPVDGYRFAGWSEDGETISTDSVYTFTVEGPRTLVANFTLDEFVISVKASPSQGGTVSGGGAYTYGASCTLKANPGNGYTFARWMKDGVQVSTDANYTFTVTEDALYTAQFTKKNYTIAATANPEDGGTISGTGTYAYQSSVTLKATANEGYTFVNWTEDGEEVSTDATYHFAATADRTLVAHFEWSTFEITAEVNPVEGGSIACEGMVDGVGTFDYGATCELTATANDGYSFTGWSVNGEIITNEETYSFTVTEAVALVANFSLDIYAVTAEANPVEGGTITGEGFSDGEGDYAYGTTCTLTATANEGYTFVNWTKDDVEVSTEATYTFTVEAPALLVAHFILNTYEITATANPTEGGEVTGAGTYNHGETCELTATAADGYSFTGWTENGETLTTEETYSFTVTGERTLVANFTLDTYAITVMADPAEGGTIEGEGFVDGEAAYDYGSTCTVTATANEGYTFEGWSVDGETVTTDATYTFTVEAPTTLVAHFTLNSYMITAEANPAEGGEITGAGEYNHGETCELTATANEGYTFEGWSENGELVTTDETLSFTVTGDRTLVANFLLNSYEITAMANPTEGGTITGEGFVNGVGTYDHGATCSLTATANEGYTFEGWSINGEIITYENTYSFTVTEAVALVATFTLDTYAVTAEADPAEGGTITGEGFVNGEGDYDYGTTCSLTATANEGYTFENWTKDGAVVSTNATYTFTVEAPAYLVAHFTLNTYEITATANPAAGGEVTGAGEYSYGATCELTATANEGYTFEGWSENGQTVTTEATYSFTVDGPRTFVANFTIKSFEITAEANPAEGGTIQGTGGYDYGETCELTANANEGYTFVKWTKDGVAVTTNPTLSFVVTESAAYVAIFSLNNYEITATANPSNGGSVDGAGVFNHGETCTLNATAAAGYTFAGWSENGITVSTDATYSFTVTGARTLMANFSLNSYEIVATANPTEGGTITGAGTYNQFFNCQLTATANPGYTFEKWTENGTTVSTDATYSFQVTGNRTLVAHFTQVSYQITAITDPEGTGDIEGAGFYHYGETCTLTVTPHAEYELISWTLDGIEVSQEETFTFVVTGSAVYTAHLRLDGVDEQHGITVSLFPNPATDKLTIEASEPVKMLEIYTINGALVSKLRNASDKVEINVEDYAIGTYMVRIITENKVEIRKFIKE